MMVRQVINNAAREGARYATVSTATVDTAAVQTVVQNFLAGQLSSSGTTIQVYLADPATGSNLGDWTTAQLGAGDRRAGHGELHADAFEVQFLARLRATFGHSGHEVGSQLKGTCSMIRRKVLRRDRRGSMLPLFALAMVAICGFVALSVDLGLIALGRTQAQNAADAAALAGRSND